MKDDPELAKKCFEARLPVPYFFTKKISDILYTEYVMKNAENTSME